MTVIATKNGLPLLLDGKLAINCECCDDDELPNICGTACPGSLEQVADQIFFVVSNFRCNETPWRRIGYTPPDGLPSNCISPALTQPSFAQSDVLTCTFARMQESHAVYSSDSGLSQSLGLPGVPLQQEIGFQITENMALGQKLIELCVPCNPALQFNPPVIARMLAAIQCTVSPFPSRLSFTNVSGLIFSKPRLNCLFQLNSGLDPYVVRTSGLFGDAGTGFFDVAIERNPLP